MKRHKRLFSFTSLNDRVYKGTIRSFRSPQCVNDKQHLFSKINAAKMYIL